MIPVYPKAVMKAFKRWSRLGKLKEGENGRKGIEIRVIERKGVERKSW